MGAIEGQRPTELPQRQLRIGAAVDLHCRPVRRYDQDRVALSDVQRDDVDRSVRLGEQRGRHEDRQHTAAEERRPEDRPCCHAGGARCRGRRRAGHEAELGRRRLPASRAQRRQRHERIPHERQPGWRLELDRGERQPAGDLADERQRAKREPGRAADEPRREVDGR